MDTNQIISITDDIHMDYSWIFDKDYINLIRDLKRLFTSLRKNEFLTSLDFSFKNIGELKDKTIINLICDEISSNRNYNLVELNLSNNEFRHDDLTLISNSLKSNKTLTSLILNENIYYYGEDDDYGPDMNRIGYEDLNCIISSLKFNTTLTNLSLEFNGFTEEEIKLISKFLINNNTITKLSLSKNIITSKGIKSLSKVLRFNTTLTSLNLSECYMDYTDDHRIYYMHSKNTNFNLFCDALKNNTALTELNLSYNILGSKGLMELSEVLKVNTSLNNLILGCIDIKTDGFISLCEVLKTNKTLTMLNLFEYINYFFENSYSNKYLNCKILCETLKINTTLTYLNLNNNLISNEDYKYICDALTVNSTLTYLNLNNPLIKKEKGIELLEETLKLNTTLTDLGF